MSDKPLKERVEDVLRRADEVLERWNELKEDLHWSTSGLSAWAESRKRDKDDKRNR